MILVIGDKNLSSWSLRPWLLMRHAEIPFTEEVRLFAAPDWRISITDVSPSGRVPCLRDGALVIGDSLAIAEYVADKFPDKKLWPRALEARAIARSISAEMHAGFANLRRDLAMEVVSRHPRGSLAQETEREVSRLQAIWSECLGRHQGAFLFGDFSIADAMFAPVAFRFRTYDIPVADPRARLWCETMLALPAMKEWERGAEEELRRAPTVEMPFASSAAHLYAVIFSSQRREEYDAEYATVASAMEELAKRQPGFLGIESARGADGFGLTVSYWDSLAAIRAWKEQADHRVAQAHGRERFYARYSIRVSSVDRAYEWPSR